jgi:hypothetical protein
MGRPGVAVVLVALLAALGCAKKEEPKADAATEQREALERAKEGPYGSQVKALEDAKKMGEDLDRKSRESVDKAEQGAK